jgi:hypothetical protein
MKVTCLLLSRFHAAMSFQVIIYTLGSDIFTVMLRTAGMVLTLNMMILFIKNGQLSQ